MTDHIHIEWCKGLGMISRYRYPVGNIFKDGHGGGRMTLNYRGNVLARHIDNCAPSFIRGIVEMFCAGCDGIDGALRDAPGTVETLIAAHWAKLQAEREIGA